MEMDSLRRPARCATLTLSVSALGRYVEGGLARGERGDGRVRCTRLRKACHHNPQLFAGDHFEQQARAIDMQH
eukprot:scaffold487_cov344-Prasinococcus_capsulatus_cf.AAC.3